jgi:diaminopimelate decarboxylase
LPSGVRDMPLAALIDRVIAPLARDYARACLIYDCDAIAARIAATRALEERHDARFLFAVKACGEPWALELMHRHGLGFDIANAAELAAVRNAALATGVAPAFLSASGPASADLFGQAGLDIVHFDGAGQLDAELADGTLLGLRVALPDSGAAPDAPRRTRFGVRPDSPDFARAIADPRFGGLHCHRPGPRSAQDIVATGAALAALVPDRSLRYLNLGGGLGALTPGDLDVALTALRTIVPAGTRIVLEPGSYWFAGAGYALGRILACEPLGPEMTRVTLDLSKDCHLHWSDAVPIAANGLPPGKVLLGGPTCHEGDIIGAFELGDAHGAATLIPPGFVLFGNVDGYSAAWNRGFNGIPAARVVTHGGA